MAITKANDHNINLRDFSGLRGLEFYDFFEIFKLKSIAEWTMDLYEDEDGKFFRFEMIGNFSYGHDTIQQEFFMWVGEDGSCIITNMKDDNREYKVPVDRAESLFKKLNIAQG